MNSEIELIGALKDWENIIIYGAGMRANVVVSRLQANDVQQKILVAVTRTHGEVEFFSGMQVHNISALLALKETALVLIATQPKYHAEMAQTAKALGFSHILPINTSAFEDMKLHYDLTQTSSGIYQLHREQKKSQFLQYQTMNLIRLNRLRDKVRRGGKVRVAFVLTSEAKFDFASIYRAMQNKALYEICLFVFDEYYKDRLFNRDNYASLKEYALRLQRENYNVVWGYDDNDDPVAIESWKPDVIIYNSCYMSDSEEPHDLIKAVHNHLSCFVPYGMHVNRNHYYHFENETVFSAWIHFFDTRAAMSECMKTSFTSGSNAVLSGWPMLDEYADEPGMKGYPEAQKRPMVIYAPHWSIEAISNLASFHIHASRFIKLLAENPEMDFVFKPHPRLGPEIRMRENKGSETSIKYDDYLAYCENWAHAANGSVVTDSSFIQLFKQAACLITDSFTFLLSWLPTKRPCIFIINPEGPQDINPFFYEFMLPVMDTYYICRSWEEFQAAFRLVVKEGNDPKAPDRERLCNELICNLGYSGEFIAEYILQQVLED